jgi:hypothetical protein
MAMPNFSRRSDLLAEKQRLEKELADIAEQEKTFSTMPLDQKVAELMHSLHCHANHTDGCSWTYESWGKPGHAHNDALKKANELIPMIEEYLHSLGLNPDGDMIFNAIEVANRIRYW